MSLDTIRAHCRALRLPTAAAIDRVVHHSLIIEFGKDVKSVRAEEAARRNGIVLVADSAAQATGG